MTDAPTAIVQADLVLPCPALADTITFLIHRVGFRLEWIAPADSPRTAVLTGFGLRLRLDREATGDPGIVELSTSDESVVGTVLTAPNGTELVYVAADPPLEIPDLRPAFVLNRLSGDSPGVGRAGMRYRDLLPDRLGGRFIASHISIPDGGPVPDYVHYHAIRFQMIFCRRGWVRLVYEDQGEPFVLEQGDCVLQPPLIRHRVLEASPGLEVVEIACPAEHRTFAEHVIPLPTGRVEPDRDFSGQRFVWHRAATAPWLDGPTTGLQHRDLGLGAATGGLAGGRVVRASGAATGPLRHDAEFLLTYVLDGAATLVTETFGTHRLGADDAVVVPAGERYSFDDLTPDFGALDVSLPAVPTRT